MRRGARHPLLLACAALLAGCASAPPSGGAATASAPDAGWTVTGEDPAYPKEAFVVGKGWSATSPEEAQRKAVAAVERQISAMVRGSERLTKSEMSVGDETRVFDQIESFSSVRAEGRLEGVALVREHSDAQGHYALAALNRADFAAGTESALLEAERRLEAALDAAAARVGEGKYAAALASVAEVPAAVSEREALRRRLRAVDASREASLSFRSLSELDALYGTIVSRLSLRLVSGNGQKLTAGDPLGETVVEVLADGVPAQGVPVALLSDDGRRPLGAVATDAAGKATLSGLAPPDETPGAHRARIGIDLRVPASWREALRGGDLRVDYEVAALRREVRLALEGSGGAAAKAELDRAGFVPTESAAAPSLAVSVVSREAGRLNGVSSTTVVAVVEVRAVARDASGKTLGTRDLNAKGMGPDLDAATANALAAVRWTRLQELFR